MVEAQKIVLEPTKECHLVIYGNKASLYRTILL